MSTPEQPETPPLTRKQMREIRHTGANPIIVAGASSPDAEPAEPVAPHQSTELDARGPADTQVESPDVDVAAGDAPEAAAPQENKPQDAAPQEHEPQDAALQDAPSPVAAVPAAPVAAAPLARATEPAIIPPSPAPDSSVDLGVSPLTRRQARDQERIRTASVPVISADLIAANTPLTAPPVPEIEDEVSIEADAVSGSSDVEPLLGKTVAQDAVVDPNPEEDADETDEVIDVVPVSASSRTGAAPDFATPVAAASEDAASEDATPVIATDEPGAERPVVNPSFGSELLAEPAVVAVTLPPSFDQLIARNASATSSQATPNALILSQAPTGAASIVSPVAATGEVLITGTFNLPEGLGSRGHVAGSTDGKEVDAVLIDGELPAHSSPTPIAASAAISTIKGTGEIIRPPAPEKGNKLMLGLIIVAGVLALAVVGVSILAIVTGVFS